MEPCLFRHGKRCGAGPTRSVSRALQWSHVFSDMVSDLSISRYGVLGELQWSHVFSDMVSPAGRNTSTARSTLQWSHVFSDMVRVAELATREGVTRASMEPCLFRHGKPMLIILVSAKHDASMEPCLFRHGKTRSTLRGSVTSSCFNGAMSFQTW